MEFKPAWLSQSGHTKNPRQDIVALELQIPDELAKKIDLPSFFDELGIRMGFDKQFFLRTGRTKTGNGQSASANGYNRRSGLAAHRLLEARHFASDKHCRDECAPFHPLRGC